MGKNNLKSIKRASTRLNEKRNKEANSILKKLVLNFLSKRLFLKEREGEEAVKLYDEYNYKWKNYCYKNEFNKEAKSFFEINTKAILDRTIKLEKNSNESTSIESGGSTETNEIETGGDNGGQDSPSN